MTYLSVLRTTLINDARRQVLRPAAAWFNCKVVRGQTGYEPRRGSIVSYFTSFIGLCRDVALLRLRVELTRMVKAEFEGSLSQSAKLRYRNLEGS